ncbi:zinc finger, CCHC-type containing protein [Tanacetum coccineum]
MAPTKRKTTRKATTTKHKPKTTKAGEEILDLVIPYIHNFEDRNSVSLVSPKFCEIDGITRKRLTVHTLYSNPSRLSKRFPFIEALTLKGLPSCFHVREDDYDIPITPWIEQLAVEFRCLKELSICGLVVNDEDLETLARTRGNDLRSLKIRKCRGFTTDGLKHVSKYCNRLRTLCLGYARYIDLKDGIWLHQLALNSTVLEMFSFKNMKMSDDAEDLTLLAKNCCNSLISLKIGKCYLSKLGDAFRYAVRLEHFGGYIRAEESELVGFKFPTNMRSLSIHNLAVTRCPNLEVLSTQDVCGDRDSVWLEDISNEALECVGTHLKNLRDFHISDLFTARYHSFAWGLTGCWFGYDRKYGANLRSLSLTHIGESDAGLVKLSKGCPKLRKLKLSYCPFSDHAVTSFVFKIPSLSGLWLSGYEKESKMGRAFSSKHTDDILMPGSRSDNSPCEVWDSLKTRFVGADRVQKARLLTFEELKFEAPDYKDGEVIDVRDDGGKIIVVNKGGGSNEYTKIDKAHGVVYRLMLAEALVEVATRGVRSGFWPRSVWIVMARNVSRRGLLETEKSRGQKSHQVLRVSRIRALRIGMHEHEETGTRSALEREWKNKLSCCVLVRTRTWPSRLVMLNEDKVFPKLHESRNSSNRDMWYLDNGASNHMTGERNMFAELNGNGSGTGFGSVDGSAVIIKEKVPFLFQCKMVTINGVDVYFFQLLTSNSLSLGQLTEAGYDVWLHNDYLKVYNEQRMLVLKVQRSANMLYKIALKIAKQACLAASVVDDAWTWHARLGHANFYTLEFMGKKRMVTGMPCVSHPKQLCSVVAKQTRKSFPNEAQWRASKPLELLHADLCGPITPQSTGGNRYFLLIVDDWCRYMWVYFLKSKDEALAKFKIFKAQVEMETEHKVKALRTDRGGEFNSRAFVKFCQKEGIQRQTTLE